jgi:rsbT co-antagonist protein RsbR
MKVSDIDFKKILKYSPDTGRLLLGADRMLLMRQEAFGVLRKLMVEQLGEELARRLLAQFGYRCGQGDYKALVGQYTWDTPMDELASGPVMHMWEGIVHVETKEIDFDRQAGRFRMVGIWRNSYEAEIHLAEFGSSDTPVCHSLAAYASGYASAFMGLPVLGVETACIGKGDESCGFELRRLDQWGPEADLWRDALALTDISLARELEAKLKEVEEYRSTMAVVGTPIIQVWKEVVVLPVVGAVDSRRAEHIMSTLVTRVAAEEIRCVLVDLTGVDAVDTRTADHFVKMARAVRLLGARCIITGIRPEVAQTLTRMGIELEGLSTLRTLKQGLEESLAFLGYTVTRQRRFLMEED